MSEGLRVCVCVRVCVQSGGLRFGSEQHIPSVISFGASHRPTRSVSGPHSFSLSLFFPSYFPHSAAAASAFCWTRRVITGETASAAWCGAVWRRHPELLGYRSIQLRRRKKKKRRRRRRRRKEGIDTRSRSRSTGPKALWDRKEKKERKVSLSLVWLKKKRSRHNTQACSARCVDSSKRKTRKLSTGERRKSPIHRKLGATSASWCACDVKNVRPTIQYAAIPHFTYLNAKREEKRREERRAVCEIFNLRARPSPVSWFVFRKSSSPRLPRPSSISGVLLHTSFPPTSPTTPPSPPPHPQSLVWLSQAAVGTAMKTRRATKLV